MNHRGYFSSLFFFARDIKISHSIFALPFVISALVLGLDRLPSVYQAFWIVLCMVCARSFAMGMNRYFDARFDALNERTKNRAIPRGDLSCGQSLFWSLVFGLVFIFSARALGSISYLLSVPLLIFLGSYSLLKRYVWWTHWYLGVCLALAPLAAIVAISESWPAISVFCVSFAMIFWTAGFDLLYSTQDYKFDVANGLNSFPQRFGISRTVDISRLCFVFTILFLGLGGYFESSGVWYYSGVIFVSALLFAEQVLIRELKTKGHSAMIQKAFFDLNAMVSVIFLFFVIAERVIGNWF